MMAGTQHAQDAYFDRAMDMVDKAQAIARDYGAALNYIACQITSDGKGGWTLKEGFDMQYFILLIQGDKP
jgi:hypothetical protein